MDVPVAQQCFQGFYAVNQPVVFPLGGIVPHFLLEGNFNELNFRYFAKYIFVQLFAAS